MRKIDERALTRSFLNKVMESVEYCECCKSAPCCCAPGCPGCDCEPEGVVDYIDAPGKGESHGELKSDEHGVVSPEELHSHFDLDGNGVVTKQEYTDHVNWHCDHPEVLDACQDKRYECMHDVPCMDSYDATMQHALHDVDNFKSILSPLMQQTGATCMDSTLQSLHHVLCVLKDCGIIK